MGWWLAGSVALPRRPSQWLLMMLLLGIGAGGQSIRDLQTEAEALASVENSGAASAKCDAEDVAWLVSRGWWTAAKNIVLAGHELKDERQSQAIATVVRREVGELKQEADKLLASLTKQKEVGFVNCAFQWSQNSSTIFLSIKFAHRWSSPGALEVKNDEGSPAVSCADAGCSFNFAATGKHSGLDKRYGLSLYFLEEVNPQKFSWQMASAGRLTALIGKKEPGKWKSLLKGGVKMKNMAQWDDMDIKWAPELKKFLKSQKGLDADLEEQEKEDAALKLVAKCKADHKQSIFRRTLIKELCEKWMPVEGKTSKPEKWLVLFYSPKEMKCAEHGAQCTKIKNFWTALHERIGDMPDFKGTKIAAVDCERYGDLCKRQEVGHLPFIRRYTTASKKKKAKRKTFYGSHDIDSIMSFLST
eukprot:TRINITY_DN38304_c0_g1_i1.p1 TRINITY_DN38304_c0_g1~~TRINITY_DN38304_c0_g1_i1.p1  ORF type:complete len:416 (+),score=143.17 TRINITY_DN38304_c0_g1_i1:70-1317(+)